MKKTRVQLIQDLLVTIDPDPTRPGLKDTPGRVSRAFDELFSGYHQDPKDVFKIFDPEGEPGQLVLLKDIPFNSFCEHHILPFTGTAHIAYIPTKDVLGASKLARLLDVYARRLQIQERIGVQVTTALMEFLQPEGAACVLKAKHLCISCRGVQKEQSEFITASLKGCFLVEPSTRSELYSMIGL